MEFQLNIQEMKDDSVLIKHQNSWTPEQIFLLSQQDAMDAILPHGFNEIETGILPPIVKYLSPSGRNIILERPPQVITLNYYGVIKDKINKETTLQQFDIPLPWTVYGITLDDNYQPLDIYVYAARRPIQGLSDKLFVLPITNCELSGKFCAPLDTARKVSSIGEAINMAYSAVWSSNFNLDITENLEEGFNNWMPKLIFNGRGNRKSMENLKISNFYKRWEEFTIDEILSVEDWFPASVSMDGANTVKSLLGNLVDNEIQLIEPLHLYNRLRTRIAVCNNKAVDIQ